MPSPGHYELAAATLSVYRDEVAKAETSFRARRGLAMDGERILAYAQAHATLAVADALRNASPKANGA